MRALKKEYRDLEGRQLLAACLRIVQDAKAEDPVALDLRGLTFFTDYFLIVSGRSTRHVQALAEALEDELHAKRADRRRGEGQDEGLWIALDLGDVVAHIFYHEQRAFYDLEGLWHDAPRVDLAELAEPAAPQE